MCQFYRSAIDQYDVHAAIPGAAFLGLVRGDRVRLAQPGCGDARGVDAGGDERIAHRLGATLRQQLVGVRVAAAVGVPFDADRLARVLVDERDDLTEVRLRLRP